MNSAPHLRLEDRPEFERVLDEALRTMARAETDTAPPLATADLRTLAVADADAIAAHASQEYGEFVRVRELLRRPAGTAAPPSGTSPSGTSSDHADPSGGNAPGDAPGPADSPTDSTGAGVFVVLSLLLPVLSGTAAVIFLLVGYALGVVSPEPALAVAMRNVGWVFAVITVATGLVGAVSLLLSASRNAPTARRGSNSGRNDGPSDEITVARAAWRHALLQRGILPFLRDAQERAAEGREGYRTPGPRLPEDDHRTPRLGYSGPDFSAQKSGAAQESTVERNRFSSPKYGSSRFSSPKYSTDGPASGESEGAGSGDASDSGSKSSGGRFYSPSYQSGSTDSSSEGRKFSSPGFKSGSTGRDRAEDARDARDDEDPGPVPDGDDARSR
ncbi:hypothetical protein JGS22_009000 [Streptomyces sp. P38-E01]|uniref:Uncharacterized protein n=1 Tax=Streptomyces tardus TaxID=2780544 RepID=A0A949JCY3_9ACTN|nr:hypothetical protein [Streptomyces tardus]MBU7597752.1 hypothetical protein [Streptomyces tardus]